MVCEKAPGVHWNREVTVFVNIETGKQRPNNFPSGTFLSCHNTDVYFFSKNECNINSQNFVLENAFFIK